MESFPLENNNKHYQAIDTLEAALAGLNKRSKAIAGNIANVNTPSYRRRVVDFEDALLGAIKNQDVTNISKTDKEHFSNKIHNLKDAIKLSTEQNNFTIDSNDVDIDREIIELTKTGLHFKGLANITKRHFDHMRSILRGG